MTTVVYTDGACLGNPGPGGWGWAVPGGRFAAGCEAQSTNQRMEIAAALDAVRTLDGPLEVVSDSTYVVNCFRDRWWAGWIQRGWLNKAKKPVANRDLWEPLIERYQQRGGATEIAFRWVKGHSGDPMNDLVDRLAVEAATTQEPRSGDEPPTTLGPADEPGLRGPNAGSGRRLKSGAPAAGAGSKDTTTGPLIGPAHQLTGHPLAVFGPKPPALGGYEDNPVLDAVRGRLRDIFAAKATMHDDLRIVSGLRLGTEMLAADAALDLGLPLDVVLPYPDPEKVWPARSQEAYRAVLARADRVVILQNRPPATKQQAGLAISRREAFLARNAVEAILVWDGVDPLFKSVHRMLEDHLGEELWVIDPAELRIAPPAPVAREGRRR
jgi:ribonuclease HI